MWQKDQLVTQLHWQENGPTFSNTTYRYQACRCEDPRGWLKEAQPRCGGVGGDWGEAGEGRSPVGCYPRPHQGAGGHTPLRRVGQAPGAEQLLARPPGLGRFQTSLLGCDSSRCRSPTSVCASPRPATSQPGMAPRSCPFGPSPVAMKSSPALASGVRQWWLGWVWGDQGELGETCCLSP